MTLTAAITERDLGALIERVEKATGPDRRIDAALWMALEPCEPPDCFIEVRRGIAARIENGEQWGDPCCPFYTSSIDAVVALVEKEMPEYTWQVRSERPPTFPKVRSASCIVHALPTGKGGDYFESAATPPLALLLAFLRARQAAASAGAP